MEGLDRFLINISKWNSPNLHVFNAMMQIMIFGPETHSDALVLQYLFCEQPLLLKLNQNVPSLIYLSLADAAPGTTDNVQERVEHIHEFGDMDSKR